MGDIEHVSQGCAERTEFRFAVDPDQREQVNCGIGAEGDAFDRSYSLLRTARTSTLLDLACCLLEIGNTIGSDEDGGQKFISSDGLKEEP